MSYSYLTENLRRKLTLRRRRSLQVAFRYRPSSLLRQVVEIFDEGHDRAVESLYFRVRGFDDVIFIRRVRTAAMTESEMAGRKLDRFAGENVTGIRTGVTRPEEWIDSGFFVGRSLCLDEGG